jgi:hypothetical protein
MLFDCLAVVVMLLISFAAPRFGERGFRRFGQVLAGVARRKRLAVAVVGLTALVACATFALVAGMPIPFVHDEFAYLLGADTFARGRLTNAIHPTWEHFESFHIFFQPTYQSKFPPGQSAAMALGQLLGHPALGVWISLSVAGAAICWMLQGWVPTRWALLGGLLSILNEGVIRHWGNTYYGGAVAMLGGALLFGALPRLMRKARPCDAILLGVGLAILANSRPYEGLVASLPAAAVLLAWICGRRRPPSRRILTSVIAPIVVVLAGSAAWMGFYNARVTGDPLTLPYVNWNNLYLEDSISSLVVRESRDYRIKLKRDLSLPEESFSTFNPRTSVAQKLFIQWSFFLRPALTIPFVFGLFECRRKSMWLVLTTLVLVMFAVLLQSTAGNPHYFAPLTGLVYLVVVRGLRRLRTCQASSGAVGEAILRGTLVVVVASVLVASAHWIGRPRVPPFALYRSQIQQRLSSNGDRHLIVVRYNATHLIYHEWVFNDADIDGARVVWARELSPPQNQRLLEYFSDRHVWLLDADLQPPEFVRHRSDNSVKDD